MGDVNNGAAFSNSLNTAQMVIDMEEKCKKAYGDDYFFLTLSRTAGGIKEVERMQHEFREDELMPAATIAPAGAAAGATSIAVVFPQVAMAGKKIYCVETGESFVCDETYGGTTVAGQIKVRGLTSATGTGITMAIPAGATLLVGTMAQEEGGAIPNYQFTKEVNKSTFVQQFDEIVFKGTDVLLGEKVYGEAERQKQHIKKWIELMRALCIDMYNGTEFRETASTTSGQRRWGMRGLWSWLAANEANFAGIPGGITLELFGSLYQQTTVTGTPAGMPLLLCGHNTVMDISAFPSATIRTNDPEGKSINWGLNVQSLTVPWGKNVINIKYDPLLSPIYGMADRGAILHPEYISQLQMNGRMPNNALMLKTNVQNTSDVHNVIDLVTGTRGFIVYLASQMHRSYKGAN